MRIEVRDGVVVIDGTPRLLVTADYPYYRDDPAVWTDRLRALRDHTGVTVVTAYLPWRHHQPDERRPPDFAGRHDPRCDVVGFLRRCHDLGLQVIIKPGPFIHAETNYGGLPDWVCPSHTPDIEPLLDARDRPAMWSGARRMPAGEAEPWPLPAPLAAGFLDRATRWLRAVGEEVLGPAAYGRGPVILAQIGNEGLFTDAAQPLWAYDYSSSALRHYRALLRRWYPTIGAYNRCHSQPIQRWGQIEPPRAWSDPVDPRDLRRYVDWGRFHAEYLAEVYRLWSAALRSPVPVVVNLNPPGGDDDSMDAWLARVQPHLWSGQHYGFTNWMGVVSEDRAAHTRYVVAAKRAAGPNLEENWGFSKLYDSAYGDAATSFHQTLLALAAGATGFNVYTGVATSGWSDDLDMHHADPYPDCAPITAGGLPTPKVETVRLLADFFRMHGVEFLRCAPVTATTLAIYPPYAAVAAWAPAGRLDIGCGRVLRLFHEDMRRAGHDYRLLDLQTATAADLAEHPSITFYSGPFLHRRAQRLLADQLRGGGMLHLYGVPPHLDEDFDRCTILADAVSERAGARYALAPSRRVELVDGSADLYLRVHPHNEVCYLTVLVDSRNGDMPIRFTLHDGDTVRAGELTAAAGGAAILRIVAGRLDDFLVKGVNAYLGSFLPASCAFAGRMFHADEPADLARAGHAVRALRPDSHLARSTP
ncbi:MAG TPA: beta-galactosidase [Pilimelia sp.]|nr:beta-galactosidase [Pilimelia sp.]